MSCFHTVPKCSKSGFHLYQSASGRYGRFEKNGPQSVGRTRGGWNTKLHMVAASDRDGVIFALSAGNCGDAPEGRALWEQPGPVEHSVYLLMDRAYEGDETRALAMRLGYIPVVPPKSNRRNPWNYDKQMYKQRNQVERLSSMGDHQPVPSAPVPGGCQPDGKYAHACLPEPVHRSILWVSRPWSETMFRRWDICGAHDLRTAPQTDRSVTFPQKKHSASVSQAGMLFCRKRLRKHTGRRHLQETSGRVFLLGSVHIRESTIRAK